MDERTHRPETLIEEMDRLYPAEMAAAAAEIHDRRFAGCKCGDWRNHDVGRRRRRLTRPA